MKIFTVSWRKTTTRHTAIDPSGNYPTDSKGRLRLILLRGGRLRLYGPASLAAQYTINGVVVTFRSISKTTHEYRLSQRQERDILSGKPAPVTPVKPKVTPAPIITTPTTTTTTPTTTTTSTSLEGRIRDANLPVTTPGTDFLMATWNIRHFGGGSRTDQSLQYIAQILQQFQLVAITELKANLTDLFKVLKILGSNWKVIFSDYISDAGGNRERMGFLYNTDFINFTGLAAEADAPRLKNADTGEYVPVLSWWRSPYMASFTASNIDFIVLSAHIRYASYESNRIAPLNLLANWVAQRSSETYVYDTDWFILGDFNTSGSRSFEALTSNGLVLPSALRDVSNSVAATNLARNKRYDQILYQKKSTNIKLGRAGVLDFYQGDHLPLYPDLTKIKFTYQLSDHLPIWVQVMDS